AEAWVREACATFVEDREFQLADEEQAHLESLAAHPEVPLDTVDGSHEYDAMGFIAFLSARDSTNGTPSLQPLWDQLATGVPATTAIPLARGEKLPLVLFGFGQYLAALPWPVGLKWTFVPGGPRRLLPLRPLALLPLSLEAYVGCWSSTLLVEADGS